jgi:hypothetical protein
MSNKTINSIDPYEAHAGKFNFTSDDVIKSTKLPTNGKPPRIIGWSGPARSGTTAMLLLLAGHPQIDRVYFQPQKTILRKGKPEFELYGDDSLICMKEVFGFQAGEDYDPIDMLLRAGISPENITWISFLRDPLLSFASWRHVNPTSPEVFSDTQAYAIDQFHKYRHQGIKVVPFAYDLLKDNEDKVVKALLDAIGLESANFSLNFDTDQIDRKLVKGQAAEKEYFDYMIKKTYLTKKYTYTNNNYGVSPEQAAVIEAKCRQPYEEFLNLAKEELHL